MVDFFDKIYTNIRGISKKASVQRFLIRILSNILIPFFFRIKKNPECVISKSNLDKKIIVSLTSFPKRINRIWLVIECLLRQTIKPDKIVLYLAKEQFKNLELPNSLLKYVRLNLVEIKFVDDLRSHKKYYYAFQEYNDDIVILVDDDIFYPTYIIKNLIDLYIDNPKAIICTRAYNVEKVDHKITRYKNWKLEKSYIGPTYSIFHTSGGGTLYTPSLFNEDIYDKKTFMQYCKFADDVWLNFHAQKDQIKTIKTEGYTEILPIINLGDIALKHHNVSGGGNDIQIKNLIELYKLDESNLF